MPSLFELSPPLLAMNAQRIDSPVSNLTIAYERDGEFFKHFAKRRMLIREAFMGEFDLEMPPGEWLQVPKLWCLVSRAAPGIHQISPMYRGRKFWSFINDDAALALILVEMARREGIDVEEFRAFERRVVAKNHKALASSGSGLVH